MKSTRGAKILKVDKTKFEYLARDIHDQECSPLVQFKLPRQIIYTNKYGTVTILPK